MKHITLLLFLLAPLFSLTGCSDHSTPEARGEASFRGYGCATCHTVAGQGGKLGPDLTYIGFRKTPEWLNLWLTNPPEWKHSTAMPNFYLKENVRKDIVAYLATLKGQGYKSNPPWDAPAIKDDSVARGKAIFKSVGCVGCHGVEGKGGNPNNNVVGGQIPGLTKVADGYSKEELISRLRLGKHPDKSDPNGPEPMIYMPAWGEVLKDDELEALAVYLFSLRPPVAESDAW